MTMNNNHRYVRLKYHHLYGIKGINVVVEVLVVELEVVVVEMVVEEVQMVACADSSGKASG
ncbi:hypothetical protein E2C01_033995 [Portunus trituberculatus]|uniref:Uncharacterized protein n=1 Tax=Portunus trituberculatus TaxID=210409 RepID=A0A5B7F4F5_PORTR|nr:hypothetical protein [Portunus trituberculatus]